MRRYARHFFDYAVSDLARHQLMNQRTLPGFEPTPESYAPAVAVLEQFGPGWPGSASPGRRTPTSASPSSAA